MDLDFGPLYPRHDLLMELAKVELAMDRLGEHDANESAAPRPAELESRMTSLREALDHLPS